VSGVEDKDRITLLGPRRQIIERRQNSLAARSGSGEQYDRLQRKPQTCGSRSTAATACASAVVIGTSIYGAWA